MFFLSFREPSNLSCPSRNSRLLYSILSINIQPIIRGERAPKSYCHCAESPVYSEESWPPIWNLKRRDDMKRGSGLIGHWFLSPIVKDLTRESIPVPIALRALFGYWK